MSQGQFGDSVLDKFATTFLALCNLADFSQELDSTKKAEAPIDTTFDVEPDKQETAEKDFGGQKVALGGLHYNIQIILPATRDPQVYNALFKSLKEHLIE